MSNQLAHLLQQWYSNKDQCEWVLGTIYDHSGACYRKAGAMMLFSSLGQQLGMLSGGCLESDISKNARKVMLSGETMMLCYDGNDEDDMSFQLGIGCGGTVYIMLQLINEANQYLALDKVCESLSNRQTGTYHQKIPEPGIADESMFEMHDNDAAIANTRLRKAKLNREKLASQGGLWLETPIIAEPHILIAGGGLDARPVVEMAHVLGWRVSLWDPRPANARKEHFINANHIINGNEDALRAYIETHQLDAAIVMTHNISLDAKAVLALSTSEIRYLALLGPTHRKQQVLEQTQLASSPLDFPIAGPAGLDIGGELPESIALSILSECHACLNEKTARSMDEVLDQALHNNRFQQTA